MFLWQGKSLIHYTGRVLRPSAGYITPTMNTHRHSETFTKYTKRTTAKTEWHPKTPYRRRRGRGRERQNAKYIRMRINRAKTYSRLLFFVLFASQSKVHDNFGSVRPQTLNNSIAASHDVL